MGEPHHSPLLHSVDRLLRIIPFDVWIAGGFASVVLITSLLNPPPELFAAILFFAAATAAYEYLSRDQSKGDQ